MPANDVAPLVLPDQAEIQRLYDELRFLDAHERTRALWQTPAIVEHLNARQLVLGGRLASRLGHGKLSRRLFHLAWQRDPADEEVRYFARFTNRVRMTVLEQLREMDRGDAHEFKDPAIAASTMVSDATIWATVRCFDIAFDLCRRAVELHSERAWVYSCQSFVFQSADRLDEALASAEEAWSLLPGAPHAASALVHVLQRMERHVDAAARVWSVWPVTQSFEVACSLLHAASTVVERHPDQAALWLPRAQEIIARLPTLAPLGGRALRDWLDGVERNMALLTRDRTRLTAPLPPSEAKGFWAAIAEQVAAAGDAPVCRMISHRPARQRHNTCLPASLAAVTHASEKPVDEDELERELSFGGTNVWRSAEWLGKRGYAVGFGRYRPATARALLDAGVPFVLLFSWDSSGHATAAVGYDALSGTLVIHDPSQPRLRHMLIERAAEEEDPVGPEMMVVVPEARREAVRALIPSADRDVRGRMIAHARALELGGAATAAPLAEELARVHPGDPQTEFVLALQDSVSGRTAAAAQRLRALGAKWPDCSAIRRMLFTAFEREGNLGHLRDALRELIERGRLPGVEMNRRWIYPPSFYAGRYAELLSRSADGAGPAWALLRRTIRYAWGDAGLYNTAGWMLLRERKPQEALLPFVVASQLAEERHDYARKVADVQRLLNAEEQGLAFLRDRAVRLQAAARGRSAWLALVGALEDYGWPDRAVGELRHALQDDGSGVLRAFAVSFFARQGLWSEAEAQLDALRNSGERLDYLRSSAGFLESRGRWLDALAVAEEWMREAPDDMDARRQVLAGVANRDGRAAACELARSWALALPDHDEMELILLGALDAVNADAEALDLLRRRVRRNPDDAWAWRDLAHRLLSIPDAGGAEIDEAVREASRVAPLTAAMKFLLVRLHERDGRIREAIEELCEAVRLEPESHYGYTRACDLLPRLPKEEQDAILLRLEELFTHTTGQWHGARPLAMRIATYRGVERALEAVDRWSALRPRDPEVMEARADLLLLRGQGKTDAKRALPLLEEAVRTFPAHSDLRLSLALAYHLLDQPDDQERTLRALLERQPANSDVVQRLAILLHARGRHDEALGQLRAGIAVQPLDGHLWLRLADGQWKTGHPVEALATLEEACRRIPEHFRLREYAAERLLDFGRFDRAQELASDAVKRFPHLGTAWLLLARTFDLNPAHTASTDIGEALHKALSLQPGLFEAADMLALFQAKQRNFAAARKVLEDVQPTMSDPAPARARLAWLHRAAGLRVEAVRDMRANVAVAPWHVWSWQCLLDWFDEDQDWAAVRDMLEHYWPAELADEAALRARRLELLAKAGTEAGRLDTEWTRLLADFPSDDVLLNTRFDQLWSGNHQEEAAALIDARVSATCTNPFVLARKVKALAWRARRGEALDLAMKIWLLPDQDTAWAQTESWNALDADQAAARLVDAVGKDFQPGLPVFGCLTAHLARHRGENRAPSVRLLSSLLTTGPHRALARLLRKLDTVTWDPARHRAAILSRLDDIGHSAWVVHLWRRNRGRWADATPIWQQAAHAALNAKSRHRIPLLSEWRQREGCEMFVVSNLTIALGAARGSSLGVPWAKVADEASGSLDLLRHDFTAQFLVCNLGCALLQMGRYTDFLDMMTRFKSYLVDDVSTAGRFWTRDGYQRVPAFLLLCERACRYDEADLRAIRRDVKDMVACNKVPTWAGLLFEQVVRARRPDAASRFHHAVSWLENVGSWLAATLTHKVH